MAGSLTKLRVAVIGCGRVSVMHFASIAESDRAVLIACCDNKEERAKEEGSQKETYTAFRRN